MGLEDSLACEILAKAFLCEWIDANSYILYFRLERIKEEEEELMPRNIANHINDINIVILHSFLFCPVK